MSFKSNVKRKTSILLLCSILIPTTSIAHVPIPPKEPGDIGRRLVNAPVADFNLTDQDGNLFRFSAARGRVILVTFVFTTCPDVCPLLTAKFAALQRALEDKQVADYLLLTITTDPERDRPAVLKDYAGRFKADLQRWSFLTGARSELANVWRNFRVNVTKTQSGDVNHTSLTTLIDRQGNRRVDYYGDRWQNKEVLKDIQWLASLK